LRIMRCSAPVSISSLSQVFSWPSAKGLQREPVTETGPGEVLVAEHDRHAPARAASGDDHFGTGDAGDVRASLPRRQRGAGLGAAADCVDGRLAEPVPPAVAEDGAGLGAGTLGQGARLTGADRPPSLSEGVFDLGALLLKFWIALGAVTRR